MTEVGPIRHGLFTHKIVSHSLRHTSHIFEMSCDSQLWLFDRGVHERNDPQQTTFMAFFFQTAKLSTATFSSFQSGTVLRPSALQRSRAAGGVTLPRPVSQPPRPRPPRPLQRTFPPPATTAGDPCSSGSFS